MRYLILEGFIDRDEFADPAFEELARLKLVMRGEAREGFAAFDAVNDLAILVESRRTIAVELAERACERVFVEEDIHACEGEDGIVAAGEQDELHQPRIIIEDRAIGFVAAIALDHLAQDGMDRFRDEAKALPDFVVVEAGNEACAHHAMMDDRA